MKMAGCSYQEEEREEKRCRYGAGQGECFFLTADEARCFEKRKKEKEDE